MRTTKGIIFKFVVLIIVFVATILLYFLLNHGDIEDAKSHLETSTLPVITMEFDEIQINTLQGYTDSIDARYIHNVVTPMDSTRQMNISIARYDNNIVGIGYELRSTDTTRLYEDTFLEHWEVTDSTVSATLNISRIPDVDEELLLIIKLITEKHGEIYYYTRIIEQTESYISSQIDFVKNFSLCTLDAEAFEAYIGNLEINASRDNTNLADVDIHSSFNNLTWGNLDVERVSQPAITITEIAGDVSCYQLNYCVRAKNDYDTYQYYDVKEFFRVKTGVGIAYLYVYNRTVEQLFDATSQNISTSRINLGLDSDLSVEYKANSTGAYLSFVKNGNLWMMDLNENKIISVFSFVDTDSVGPDNVPVISDQHDISIVSTDNSGNILFIVYGYMEKGYHEGQIGVALYRYTLEDNKVRELVFIPSTKPFDILKSSVGNFAYLNDDGILYFMIDDSIYTVTMDSNEYMQLASNLQQGNYIINNDSTILAWHENTSIYQADSIRVIDVEAKKDYKITANEGEYLKVIGFVDNDLIYGVARAEDITTDSSGNTIFPMYKMNILLYDTSDDDGNNEIEVYEKENMYISDVSVQDNILSISRLTKDNSGNFVAATDDRLVNRTADKSDIINVTSISTTLKKKELVMYFAYTITSSNKLSVVYPEEITFTTSNKLNLNYDGADEKYYVYAYGRMYQRFDNLNDAIACANSNYGMVAEGSGKTAWAKITKPDLAKLTDTTALVKKQYTGLSDILSDKDYLIYNLTGSDFSYILYYGAHNIPVITYTKDLGFVILSAYSGYYGVVDTVAFTSLSSGEITKMDYSAAVKAVAESGNIFVVMQ